MTDHIDPTAPETAQLNPEGPQEHDHVLEDVRAIMQVVGEQYLGEQRIDVSNEVADTVRLAHASTVWTERVTPEVQLVLHLQHEHLPSIVGQMSTSSIVITSSWCPGCHWQE
jgi:hypothetical protein